jgi:hypothetical protein
VIPDFITMELDTVLLSTLFEVETNIAMLLYLYSKVVSAVLAGKYLFSL